MVLINIKMEMYILENTKMAYLMEKENMNMLMEMYMKGNIKKI